MRPFSLAGLTALAALMGSGPALADPPRVIKAVPDNGDTDVDPALKEMRVEFDQDMMAGSYSICGGGETFPMGKTKPRWMNRRTLVIPLTLEPEREYHLGINCQSFRGFKNVDGESAEIGV